MEHLSDDDIDSTYKRLIRGARGVRYRMSSQDHPNYKIVKIGQNTEKISGELSKLVFTQTPVKDHQFTQGVI